jgi:hypothetical protein
VEASFAGGFPFEVFHGVGDVSLGPIHAGFFEGFIEHSSGRANERLSFEVLLIARLFAYKYNSSARRTFAKDGLCSGAPERAGFALFGRGSKDI